MLRIKELNLTCMINDSERITEKLGHRKEENKMCILINQKKRVCSRPFPFKILQNVNKIPDSISAYLLQRKFWEISIIVSH